MQLLLSFNPIKLGLLSFLILPIFASTAQTCKATITPTTSHLVDNNNGTVNDSNTGLIWKKCSEGEIYNATTNSCTNTASIFTWDTALQQAQDVNSGSTGQNFVQTDWRVPNINELASIAELSCYSPAINETVFPNVLASVFWSSSPLANNSNGVWIVYFEDGQSYPKNKYDNLRVRLVRSGH